MNENIEKGFTHGGIFHADDVFATALLVLLNPNIKIERGFEVPKDYDGIVYDIGGGEFDHHKKDKRIRENGVPYAAFGLLWEKVGTLILSKEDAQKFDEEFIQPLDLSDNTGEPNELSHIIADRNPSWEDEVEDSDVPFFQAVNFATEILVYRFKQIRAKRRAFAVVQQKAMKCQEKVLCLEKCVPWKEAVKGQGIFYMIFPSLRGGYCVQAVPTDEDKTILKKPFPQNWRGATKEELVSMTGVESFGFCHPSGFLCSVGTLEDAKKLAKMAVEM